jgi:uncharacterized RDD family membrane protein YckC
MERFRAPFSLRCGAMLIDYILLAGIIAFCTLLARLSSSHAQAAGSSAWTIGVFVAIAAALLNFVGLTSLRGQTVGKWATGLYVRRADGEPLSLGRSLVRHLVGYPVSLVLAGIGFLMAAFNANGRALHDLIAGTIVERQDQRRSRRAR